ncbi:hypothetical protein KJ636_03865 [Patescibacteria group bacterium]|nr:hypothetical protein [Patescibacteria group bacterium]
MMIVFACISPHPPIILPSVGSLEDRAQVKNTILALEKLGEKLKKLNPEKIIISAPHPDWGIKVPLHFLSLKCKMKNEKSQFKIKNCPHSQWRLVPLLEGGWSLRFSSRWAEI